MERSIRRELCSWSRSLTKRSLWKRQEPRSFTHLCTCSQNRGGGERSNWSQPEWNAEDSSVPAKIACATTRTPTRQVPTMGSICARCVAQRHLDESGEGKNQCVFKCHLISSQWRHPHCLFLPTDTEGNDEARGEPPCGWSSIGATFVIWQREQSRDGKRRGVSSLCKIL